MMPSKVDVVQPHCAAALLERRAPDLDGRLPVPADAGTDSRIVSEPTKGLLHLEARHRRVRAVRRRRWLSFLAIDDERQIAADITHDPDPDLPYDRSGTTTGDRNIRTLADYKGPAHGDYHVGRRGQPLHDHVREEPKRIRDAAGWNAASDRRGDRSPEGIVDARDSSRERGGVCHREHQLPTFARVVRAHADSLRGLASSNASAQAVGLLARIGHADPRSRNSGCKGSPRSADALLDELLGDARMRADVGAGERHHARQRHGRRPLTGGSRGIRDPCARAHRDARRVATEPAKVGAFETTNCAEGLLDLGACKAPFDTLGTYRPCFPCIQRT